MSAAAAAWGEFAKLPAFLRRDLLGARRRRAAFAADVPTLGGQLVVLAFVGRLVDPAALPTYGGTHVTFIEFVTIGVAAMLGLGVTIRRCATALRHDQLQGTLEPLLLTPASITTLHVGAVALDLLWLPLRIGAFLLVAVVAFDLDYDVAGIGKAAALLAAALPFAWGVGLIGSALILRLRRGAGGIGLAVGALAVASGAYFPLSLLPGWLEATGRVNPVAVAFEGMRGALLGDRGWNLIASDLALLLPASALAVAVGSLILRHALGRELRDGTWRWPNPSQQLSASRGARMNNVIRNYD